MSDSGFTQLRVCCVCRQEKELSSFYRRSNRPDGYNYMCKSCSYLSNRRSYLKYKEKNDRKKSIFMKEYDKKNRDKRNEYMKGYISRRRKSDPGFKLLLNLRRTFLASLRENKKYAKTLSLIGCSVDELKVWLEQQFYPNPETGKEMTWDNYGRGCSCWNIDHIIPLSSFDLTDPAEQRKVVHWFNLRPLWAEENMKRSKVINYVR